jgi:hypothetical protein
VHKIDRHNLRTPNQDFTVTERCVGFEVLTAVSTKMAVFWVVAPCIKV